MTEILIVAAIITKGISEILEIKDEIIANKNRSKRLIERIRSLEPAIDSIHNIIIELLQSNLLLGYQKPLKIVINFYVNFVGKFG